MAMRQYMAMALEEEALDDDDLDASPPKQQKQQRTSRKAAKAAEQGKGKSGRRTANPKPKKPPPPCSLPPPSPPLAPYSSSSAAMKGRQGQRVRLYVRGTILGYKRSKSNQYENTSLLQIEGVNTKEEVGWYAGKRIAYVYKAKTKSNDSTIRCIWGKVTRPHGNSGVVRAKFRSNLPPTSMGKKVRVFMYPSSI